MLALNWPTEFSKSAARVEPACWRRLTDIRATDTRLHVEAALPGELRQTDDSEGGILDCPTHFSFKGPRDHLSVSAHYEHFDRDLDPMDWLDISLERTGWRTTERLEEPSPFGNLGEILATRSENGEELAVRSRVLKDGPWMLALAASYPVSRQDDLASWAHVSTSCFRQVSPGGSISAEETLPERLGICRFVRPSSWSRIDLPLGNGNGPSLELRHTHEEAVTGLIDIEILPSREDPDDAIVRRLDRLRSGGVRMEGCPIVRIERSTGLPALLAEAVGSWRGQDMSFETWAIPCGTSHALLGLVSASRNASPALWAMNRRTLDVARTTIELATGRRGERT